MMTKNKYDPKSLDEALGGWSNKIKHYASATSHLGDLEQCKNEYLGPILSKKCRVAHYRDNTVIIEAASATLATRLNYLKMDLLSAFRTAGFYDCIQVKITTNPEAQTRLAEPSSNRSQSKASSKKPVLSQSTAHQLEALAEAAPPGLREKLLKLARHTK